MGLQQKLFGFHGRIGRADFWSLSICVALVSLCVGFAISTLMGSGSHWPAQVKWALFALTLWPDLALRVKRGHDRNRPAAWSIGTLVVATGVSFFMPTGSLSSASPLGLCALVVGSLLGFYILIDYAFLAGSPEPNRYGEPRLSQDAELEALAKAATAPEP